MAESIDLLDWRVVGDFWNPHEYFMLECPDLFKIGDWWYLIYSTFSERRATHYRMSRQPNGPWTAPPDDLLDERIFYAAKTGFDGSNRYAIGWLSDMDNRKDDGNPTWAGSLIVHKIIQRSDGTLGVTMPESKRSLYNRDVELLPTFTFGEWSSEWSADASSRYSALIFGKSPDECIFETTVTFESGTKACGLILKSDDCMEGYYELRLEPDMQRMVFDRWPRKPEVPFMLERPVNLRPGKPVRLSVYMNGNGFVAYADDVALSSRMNDHVTGLPGLFVTEGKARFDETRLLVQP